MPKLFGAAQDWGSRMRDAVQSTISVALCTFNGERFLSEQLASIAAQTRPPDELVVCDDRSTDRTTEIVDAFSRTVPFPVRLRVNDRRLGSTKNFERAIAFCRGEFIALCDQDDVWHSDKLAQQERVLRSTELVAVFSDGEVVGSNLEPLGYTLWSSVRFGRKERRLLLGGRAYNLLVKRDVVCGATLMFDARYRDAMLPIPHGWYHDAWIAFVAAAMGQIELIDRSLIRYRHHGGNQVGAPRAEPFTVDLNKRLADVRSPAPDGEALQERYRNGSERLRQLSTFGVDPAFIVRLDARAAHLERRARLPRHPARRIRVVVGELLSGRYHRYSAGLRSAGKDLVVRS